MALQNILHNSTTIEASPTTIETFRVPAGLEQSKNFITARFSVPISSGASSVRFPTSLSSKTVSVATPRGRHYGRATRDFITDAQPYAPRPAIAYCVPRVMQMQFRITSFRGSPEIYINCQNFGNAVVRHNASASLRDIRRASYLFPFPISRKVRSIRSSPSLSEITWMISPSTRTFY